MPSRTVSPARSVAFQILKRVEEGAYASVLLAAEKDLSPRNHALANELVLGVLRWQLWLDSAISYFADRDVARLDADVLIVLRLGLYQLRFLSRIPDSAAVNESVNLVHKARLRSAEAFVNAVLRRATREPEYDPAERSSNFLERIAIQTSHPLWLIERWVRAFGESEAEAFARANNCAAPVAFRVVTLGETEQVIAELRKAGATVVASEISPNGWRCEAAQKELQNLVSEGRIYLQDEASQLVGHIISEAGKANAKSILDLCAAPGGKTTQIAGHLDLSTVVAADLHRSRIRMVRNTAEMHGLANISCVQLDGLRELPFEKESFCGVLLDAPCSGTGTLRRNPEIRWRITPEDIRALAVGQKRLIDNAARVVKPGGFLVYSTCSVEQDENEEIVAEFLQAHPAFQLAKLPLNSVLLTPTLAVRTWPHRDQADGFFIAMLRRQE